MRSLLHLPARRARRFFWCGCDMDHDLGRSQVFQDIGRAPCTIRSIPMSVSPASARRWSRCPTLALAIGPAPSSCPEAVRAGTRRVVERGPARLGSLSAHVPDLSAATRSRSSVVAARRRPVATRSSSASGLSRIDVSTLPRLVDRLACHGRGWSPSPSTSRRTASRLSRSERSDPVAARVASVFRAERSSSVKLEPRPVCHTRRPRPTATSDDQRDVHR